MKKILLLSLGGTIYFNTYAQNIDGHLGGSFESYTQVYMKDSAINAILPQDRIGSNNWLKLDYNYKRFALGVQFESYLPSIAGFPFSINQSKIANKYFRYTANKFSIQVGDIYEQFGSGLIFRAWENRQIGINNSVEGASVQVQPLAFLKLKGIYGRPRKVFEYANAVVRGADAEIDFSQIKKESTSPIRVATGLSYVNRYQEYTGPDPDFPATVKAAAARLSVSGNSASVSVEYVYKDKDPHDQNNFDNSSGKAFLLNGSFAKGRLGINLNFRGMENMDFRGEREAIGIMLPVNYIPALTKQHDYLTTNIYVYNAQARGEIGGQVDIFYNLSKDPSKPSDIAVNFSHHRALDSMNNIFSFGDPEYFHDLNIEWKKKWNEKWKMVLGYYNIFYNKSVIEGGLYDNITAHIAVLNSTYKFTRRNSLRFELQHLYTKEDKGNWAAAVTEFSFAPKWSFFLSDLYNYGDTDLHYPNVGGSYTKGGTRFGMSYGRQRAGLFCVGGVCRLVPAASGITATLTVTFND
jgi:hypothetical protein